MHGRARIGTDAVDEIFSTINDEDVPQALQSNCMPMVFLKISIVFFILSVRMITPLENLQDQSESPHVQLVILSIDHCSNCPSWDQRCRGFGDAVGEGCVNNSHIIVDPSNVDTYYVSSSDGCYQREWHAG